MVRQEGLSKKAEGRAERGAHSGDLPEMSIEIQEPKFEK
jgi:hypothetical protein